MKKPVLFLLGSCVSAMVFGQSAQLVFKNDPVLGHPWVVFNPDPTAANTGAYIVIENPGATGIVQIGLSQPIIKSEAEQNRIRWVNVTGTVGTTYTVPFSTASGVAMPLSVVKNTAGAGGTGASMVFATFNHAANTGLGAASWWDNNQYRPTDVTHMNDFATGSINNSANAIDRFWIIDPYETSYNYTTKPDVTLTFKYDPVDINAGNTAGLAANLGAQRFNAPVFKWGDMPPAGTAGVNQVTNAGISSANFFRSWTLSNSLNPLPIELTSWKGACDGSAVTLTWSTATEHDNDYFTIEKSRDANVWNPLATVDAVGNSLSENNYSYVDAETNGLAYYRLSQTDNNGFTRTYDVVAAGCDAENTEIVNAWDDGAELNVAVSSTENGVYDVSIMDAQGKLMKYAASQVINEGFTTLKMNKQGIATGVYVVEMRNVSDVMTRRVMLY